MGCSCFPRISTSAQRTLAELEQTYALHAPILSELLAQCRDLYLLVDTAETYINDPKCETLPTH